MSFTTHYITLWGLYEAILCVRAVGSNSEAYSDDRESKGVEVTLMFRVSCFSCYIRLFAVNGRLRCANRPYMMWHIVTSPSSPALLPQGEKGAKRFS